MARNQFSLGFLSGQTCGRAINISATTNGGAQTLHTVPEGTSYVDFVTIEAANATGTARKLYLLVGGTTEPDDLIIVTILPYTGPQVVLDARPLQDGATVKAYGETTLAVNVWGSVERKEF